MNNHTITLLLVLLCLSCNQTQIDSNNKIYDSHNDIGQIHNKALIEINNQFLHEFEDSNSQPKISIAELTTNYLRNEGFDIDEKLHNNLSNNLSYLVTDSIYSAIQHQEDLLKFSYRNMYENGYLTKHDLSLFLGMVDLLSKTNSKIIAKSGDTSLQDYYEFDVKIEALINPVFKTPQHYSKLGQGLVSIVTSSKQYWTNRDISHLDNSILIKNSGSPYLPVFIVNILVRDIAGAIIAGAVAGLAQRAIDGDWSWDSDSRLTDNEAMSAMLWGAIDASLGATTRIFRFFRII